jgi:hypothetical protein
MVSGRLEINTREVLSKHNLQGSGLLTPMLDGCFAIFEAVNNDTHVEVAWPPFVVMDTGVPQGVFGSPAPVPTKFLSRVYGCGIPAKFTGSDLN